MKRPGIAVKSFIVKNKKLLIIKRASNDIQKPNAWEIPGGRLESGENPFSGLKRETKEETGIDIEIMQPLSVRHFTRDDGQAITMIEFLCKPLNDNVKLSDEHSEYEWISIKKSKTKLINFFHESVDAYNKLKLNQIIE